MKPDNEQKAASTRADPPMIADDEARVKSSMTISELLAMPGIEDIEIDCERSTDLVKPANLLD